MGKISRRDLLKVTGLGITVGTLQGVSLAYAAGTRSRILPPPKGKRVVIVGGGWAGVTAAKYLRKEEPGSEVILIEERKIFMSCPISNVWLAVRKVTWSMTTLSSHPASNTTTRRGSETTGNSPGYAPPPFPPPLFRERST